MKKLWYIPLLAAIMAVCTLTASAAPAVAVASPVPTRLSPALDVLAGELTLTKTGLVSREITFSPRDFESLLGVGRLSSITVLTLPDPAVGVLYLESTPVMKNQVISRSSLSALKFVPATAERADCTFVFGTVSTSQPLALSCTLRLTDGLNFAPQVQEGKTHTASTIVDIPVWGDLSVADPEGDALTYRVTAYPEHGTLRIVDRAAGTYCYTPLEGYAGKDSFTYHALDEYGNASAPVTVSLTVEETAAVVRYCDMEGNRALLPAMRLAEQGVMIGETIGASAYFHPQQVVTRAEFLAMTLCAAGLDIPDTDAATAFADDASIPSHLRRYVAYAAAQGYVTGSLADGTGYFEPHRGVTYAEAAVMLQNILGLTATGATSVFADDTQIPAWAESAVWAVAEAGLFPTGIFAPDSSVTRADAAVMLAGVLER